jgi:adenylate cyclase
VSDTAFLRRKLTGDGALVDFAVLEKFRDEGETDYLINASAFSETPTTYSSADGMIASWLTDRQLEFSDRYIAALMRIQKRLAVACKVTIKEQTAHNVLNAYLGRSAGDRVLQGQIKLGDGGKINAVIWFSDLRGSRPLAESVTKPEFLAILNDYFEVTAWAVIANGGEVLRFIGDAVLAIFPIDVDGMSEHAAAEAAAAAIQDANERLIRANETRIADCRRQTHNFLRHRPTCGRSPLRQYRRPRTGRIQRHQCRRQRSCAHRITNENGRPPRPGEQGLRRPLSR